MEVLQTSPLATWVRRRCVENACRGLDTDFRSRPLSGRAGRHSGLRAALRSLLLLALLFLLLTLFERFHAAFRFAPLTDVALEGPSSSHDVTSGDEEGRTYPGVPWRSRRGRAHWSALPRHRIPRPRSARTGTSP